MATTIKLPPDLISSARRYGNIYCRSVPGQIEYWSRIGKIVEENPELSYSFIKDILLAQSEAEDGNVTKYEFS